MNQQRNSRALHIILWIVQVLLAAAFFMAGMMKGTQPMEKVIATLPWAADISPNLVRFIGVCEMLGAVGLILPALLRIAPKLTPWAAIGIMTIMILAAVFHISRGETQEIMKNIPFALVAAFIAWGRFFKVPVRSGS